MEVLFTTIVSKYRLHQCIALYHSLRKQVPEAILAILVVDSESRSTIDAMMLPGIIVIGIDELGEGKLKQIRAERQLNEYCWTLKPVMLLYLMDRFREYNVFAYLDSDLFFFDNPMKLLKSNKKWYTLLTTHKVNRKVNGGFAAFRRSSQTLAMLEWWKDKCMEWCFSINEDGKFGDQGYLDQLRTNYKGVYYLDNPGANVAHWNSYQYDIALKDDKVYINKSPLIFYHFSGLRLKRIESSVVIYGAELPCAVCGIYKGALQNSIKQIEEAGTDICKWFYDGI